MKPSDTVLHRFLDRLTPVRKYSLADKTIDFRKSSLVDGDRDFGFAHGGILRHTLLGRKHARLKRPVDIVPTPTKLVASWATGSHCI